MNNKRNLNLSEGVKSKVIQKKIFSLILYKKTINLIRYNKKFQKMFEIDIENYKKRSGRYKTGEKNGKGQEFTSVKNKLIFEGEYIEGRKCGKGVEYHECNGKIKFEGEYLNGKWWNGIWYNINGEKEYEISNGNGKIKEYYSNGKIKFECEYVNGVLIGKGKEYHEYNGEIKFEGEYFCGLKWNGTWKNFNGEIEGQIINGKGVIIDYYKNGELKYEIDYLNGEKSGKGTEYYNNGELRYEGKYFNGEKNGKGKEYYNDGQLLYKGEYLNGKINGEGKLYKYKYELLSGKLEEQYKNGKRWVRKLDDRIDEININEDIEKNKVKNGKKKEYFKNGKLKFDGEYLNGIKWNGTTYHQNGDIYFEIKNGKGEIIEYLDNNRYYVGEYSNGKWEGKGKFFFGDRLIFEGEYSKGHKVKGKDYLSDGKLVYEGEFLNGKKNGKGKQYEPLDGKLIYEGEFLNEERNGKGKEYFHNGKLKFEGEFLKNKKWNGIGYNFEGDKVFELKEGKGNVKEYNCFDELEYEGEYLNGEKNGKGKLYENGHEYVGEFLNGEKIEGEEKGISDKYLFKGKYLNGKMWEGKIKIEDAFILGFEGKYLNGKINGKGKEFIKLGMNNEILFSGKYLNGKRWNGIGCDKKGKGKQIFEIKNGYGVIKHYYFLKDNMIKLEFKFTRGRIIGEGAKYYKNGKKKFKGEFKLKRRFDIYNDLPSLNIDDLIIKEWNGIGYDPEEKEIYRLENGKGSVVIYDDDGKLMYEGEYLNGEKNGQGKEYDNSGKLVFEGEYLSGMQWKGIYRNGDYAIKNGKKNNK